MIIKPKPLRVVEQLLFGEQRPGLPGKGGNTLSKVKFTRSTNDV